MKLHIDDSKEYLVIDECSMQEYEQLKISYNKDVEKARWSPAFKAGRWDGKINFMKGKYLPAGTYQYLFDICEQFGFECEISNLSEFFDTDLDYEEFKNWCDDIFKDHPKYKPRYYQIDAAYRMLRSRRCMAQLATSAGKTMIAFLVFMYLLNVKKVGKVVMIVPKVDLVLQPTADFEDYNNGKFDLKIQQIFSGCKVKPDANIYIGTYQSLVKECGEYFSQFGAVLTDECLHPNTLITMADGTKKKICDVKIGEKVYTFNTSTSKEEVHEVEYVYKNLSKNKQMFEIELEDGTIVKITGNHKVLLSDGTWKRADELIEGDDVKFIKH